MESKIELKSPIIKTQKATILCFLTGWIEVVASVYNITGCEKQDAFDVPFNVNAVAWCVLSYGPDPFGKNGTVALYAARHDQNIFIKAVKIATKFPPLRQTWVEFSGNLK